MNRDVPVWLGSGRAVRQYPWMDGDVSADVCIIGGGVTGTLCALRLIREGKSVVLLTRSPIGRGATSLLMPCSLCDCGQELRGLSRRIGRDGAVRLLQLTRRAALELEELCSELPGGAGFALRDCVVYADSDTEADRLRREYGEYRRAGFDCTALDRGAFGSAFAFPAAGALVMRDGAVELDPYRLAQLTAAQAADHGAIIFENTKAERISEESSGRVKVYTSTHRRVSARKVVIAAGSACAELLGGIAQGRTRYIAASRPVRAFRGWPGRCVVRSSGQPGIICSASPDDRVLISSESTAAADGRERLLGALHIPAFGSRRYEELEAAARYLFPEIGITGCESGWAFRALRTADGLPVVGTAQGQPGCIFAFSGGEGGVLLSVMISRLIADMICERQSAELEMFSPRRKRRQRNRKWWNDRW